MRLDVKMIDSKVEFEYTNSCTCEFYDAESDEYYETEYCNGYCYDTMIEDFEHITSHLFDMNETGWWMVSNLRLWDGNHSGFIKAQTAPELLRGMGVNGDWIMRGKILEDSIQYSLSHHDAPMGSSSMVTIVTESDMEHYGLYL